MAMMAEAKPLPPCIRGAVAMSVTVVVRWSWIDLLSPESQSVSKVERRLSWIDLWSPESQSCVHLPATKYCHRRGGAPGKNVTCKQPKPIKLFV